MTQEKSIDWLDEFVGHIRQIHANILKLSGGAPGEHTERLVASCARPFQSAFGEPAFESEVEKAGALFHGLITSHVFVDGNKRTATAITIFFLMASGYAANVSSLQVRLLGEVAVDVASSLLDTDQATQWLRRIFGGWSDAGFALPATIIP